MFPSEMSSKVASWLFIDVPITLHKMCLTFSFILF